MAIITRNNTLRTIAKDVSLASDFESEIIDFNEMNVAFIQTVQTLAPDNFDGTFSLKVSLLCDVDSFTPFPDSERILNASCNNFAWSFCCVPFRYARVCYTANSVTTGTVSIYARAKRT